jgi:sugar phosphate isomerase/epimerase
MSHFYYLDFHSSIKPNSNNMYSWNRRSFIKSAALGTTAFTIFPACTGKPIDEKKAKDPRFKISLAQWSLHNTLNEKKLDHLDFPKKAVEAFGIYGVEYVNQFFKDKATDSSYLAEMNKRAKDLGVTQLLIMIDGEGGLAEPDDVKRKEAVINHHKWVDAAKTLGCHSIRVNAFGTSDDPVALHKAAVDGLGSLTSYAQPIGINVIVENHGGYSSDGQWLSGVMKEINMANCGTLPDFGNFCIRRRDGDQWESPCVVDYDRYKGVEEMMPYAKAVSAKSYDFDDMGNETSIDYARMMDIVKQSSYSGYLGIEYEGTRLSEDEGILATNKLLERLIA